MARLCGQSAIDELNVSVELSWNEADKETPKYSTKKKLEVRK